MRKFIFNLILLALSFASINANAFLIPVSGFGNQIVQQDANYYWLADANLAKTNHFGISGINTVNGTMSRDKANEYIDAVNAASYLGQNDWRILSLVELDLLWNNELGSNVGSGHPKQTLFTNLKRTTLDCRSPICAPTLDYISILGSPLADSANLY